MKAYLLFLFLLVWLLLPSEVYAVTLLITSYPQKIDHGSFTVGFTVTGAKPATNYFKVLLHHSASKKYIAQTWNGNTWYDGSEGKEYFPLAITSSSSGEIKAQIQETVENGTYELSLKRYTASGTAADDDISPVIVEVNVPQVTSTPTPTKMPTPVPTPISTPVPITPTPIVTVASEVAVFSEQIQATLKPVSQTSVPVIPTTVTETTKPAEVKPPSIHYQWILGSILLALIGVSCIGGGGYKVFKTHQRLI